MLILYIIVILKLTVGLAQILNKLGHVSIAGCEIKSYHFVLYCIVADSVAWSMESLP